MNEDQEVNDKKWLSCQQNPRHDTTSSRKRRRRSSREPILCQKKLPRHWREREDMLLTELDLIQPAGCATKQSSMLSFLGVSKMTKSEDFQTPEGSSPRENGAGYENEDSAQQNEIPESTSTTNYTTDIKDESFKGKQDSERICDSSPNICGKGEVKENHSPLELKDECDSADARLSLSPESRRFVCLSNVEDNLHASSSTQNVSHISQVKGVSLLSLRRGCDSQQDSPLKRHDSCDKNVPHLWNSDPSDEAALSEMYSSQNTPTDSEDECSDLEFSADSNNDDWKRSRRSDREFVVNDRDKRDNAIIRLSQSVTPSFSEQSLTFTNLDCDTRLPRHSLSESQKARKELYKAEMGTLHFTQSESAPFNENL